VLSVGCERIARRSWAEQSIRVIELEGQLIRELTLDPSRSYQPISQVCHVHDVPTHVSGTS